MKPVHSALFIFSAVIVVFIMPDSISAQKPSISTAFKNPYLENSTCNNEKFTYRVYPGPAPLYHNYKTSLYPSKNQKQKGTQTVSLTIKKKGLHVTAPHKHAANVQDSLALADLFFSTNGHTWANNSNWLTGTVSNWYGITLNDLGRVTHIVLDQNNLAGVIPASIGNLDALTELSFYDNMLIGTIPHEIGNLTRLTILYLGVNSLEGNLPEETGYLTQLEHLWVQNNRLSGIIPSSLGNLTHLISSNFGSNRFTGTLPVELGNLTNMEAISLSNNQLSGEIPEQIFNMAKVWLLWMDYNDFEGNLSPSVHKIKKLRVFLINNNRLEGPVPDSLYTLHQMEDLRLSHNHFTGSISSTIGNLSLLNTLFLDHNQLSGPIPEEICQVTALQNLYLQNNQLSGTIPQSIGQLSSLNTLNISNNLLSGAVPFQISQCQSLVTLLLSGNAFTDSLPSGLSLLWNLSSLEISSCSFSFLPDLSPLTKLDVVCLDRNNFDFGDLLNLNVQPGYVFDYSPQSFITPSITTNNDSVTISFICQGQGNIYQWYNGDTLIPGQNSETLKITTQHKGSYYCVVTNPSFQGLSLYTFPHVQGPSCLINGIDSVEYHAICTLFEATNGNNWTNNHHWLSAVHASEWAGITIDGIHITAIELSDNNLTGTIPPETGNLHALKSLILDNNQLTGEIPVETGMLEKLQTLWLASNNLTGDLPETLGNLTALKELALSGNYFTGQVPASFSQLLNLEIFLMNYNDITDIPVLTFSNLLIWDVSDNRLTFEDIEPNLGCAPYFIYFQQKKVGLPENYIIYTGETLTLSVYAGGEHNLYQWYKNNTIIEGAASNEMSLSNPTQEDTGIYVCKITNSVVNNLELVSENKQVTVLTPVVETHVENYSVVFPNPTEGLLYFKENYPNITRIDIVDGFGKIADTKTYNHFGGQIDISGLSPGMYLLKITSGTSFRTCKIQVK